MEHKVIFHTNQMANVAAQMETVILNATQFDLKTRVLNLIYLFDKNPRQKK